MTTEITDMEIGIFIGMFIFLTILCILLLIYYVLIKLEIRNKRKKIFYKSIENSLKKSYDNNIRINQLQKELDSLKMSISYFSGKTSK